MHDTVTIKRPVVRYHGGKWMLAPWIISHFPEHRIYIEPYGGGGSVLLQKYRAYAEVYNDLDGEIVNLFQVLRDARQSAELERRVALTPFARDEFAEAYTLVSDPVELARKTLIRGWMGFGSTGASGRKTGFRSNVTRSGTTPATDWRNFPQHIKTFTDRLAAVVIENRPAFDVMTQFDGPDTLHYLDPPYPHSTRTETAKWDRIYRHEMVDDDHRNMASVIHSLKGKIVLSGYPCDLYDKELFPDWYRVERPHLADGAKKRTEVLWMNFIPRGQTSLFDMPNVGAGDGNNTQQEKQMQQEQDTTQQEPNTEADVQQDTARQPDTARAPDTAAVETPEEGEKAPVAEDVDKAA